MKAPINPFMTSGYLSADYFCDRQSETENLIREITNGNNTALISTRRMGKTGLIKHCFEQERVKNHFYTFFIDIYATKSLRDFIFILSKEIIETLKPFGKKAVEIFWNSVKSLQGGISFDLSGNPSFNVSLGDINAGKTTLDEIFAYLANADKPCIVAIDEFQQISSYADQDNMEAVLRTYIQHCANARFIFAGSQRHTMGNMFLSASRPFYQSVSMLYLDRIPREEYVLFAQKHFERNKKNITAETVETVYSRFDGITWYVQKILNVLFSHTNVNGVCTAEMVPPAIESIIDSYRYAYSETLFRLPEKQKELLVAIAKAGKAKTITSSEFIQKYKLASASSVQSAQKVLLEKDYITTEEGIFSVYDRFFEIWLREKYG